MRSIALLPLFALLVAPLESRDVEPAGDGLACTLQDGEKPQEKPAEKPAEKPQDPPKPEVKEEELELEIVPVERPAAADMQQDPKFKLKEPLSLEGRKAEMEALRKSLASGMTYLLELQQEDGCWKYDSKAQVREEVPKNERYFVPTAGQSMNKVVLTSLVCMALRAHQPLAPDRVEAAVKKGLEYVIEFAPKHTKKEYGVWTWSFSIEFLVAELLRTKDEELKGRLRSSIEATLGKLVENQRAGTTKPPAVLPAMAKEEKKEEKPRKKGYFGVTPMPTEDELPGVLVQQVQKGSPAQKAGILAGDRILEINGVRVTGIEHLYEAVAFLVPGEPSKVKVLRGAKSGKPLRATQNFKDGGWSYYTWTESATNCTATALITLQDVKAAGIEIPAEAVDRAVVYLAATRMRREGETEEGYRYTMADRGPGLDVRATIGRIAVCTLALKRSGKATEKELEESLELFVKRRGELDKVLGYPGNHVPTSYYNSAYYFTWAHYYAARAVRGLENKEKRKTLGQPIQEALLKLQHEKGTWTDHEAWGQVYGTSMVLMALGELRFLSEDAYKTPVTGLEKKERKEYR
jgi:hypothetical protein